MTGAHDAGRAVRTSSGTDRLELLDRSCGTCPACTAGWPAWCVQPTLGRPLCSIPVRLNSQETWSWLMLASALLVAGVANGAVLLVLAPKGADGLAALLRLVHAGPVLFANDATDSALRAKIADLSATGRADAVASLCLAREAVRAVSRGGIVCLSKSVVDLPSVTELAQREVKLVSPRDVALLVQTIGRAPIEEVFDAA